MSFLRNKSPVEGVGDLRRFLSTRRRSDLVFAFPALILTMLIVFGFHVDMNIPREYKRNIIYVESWPITRTDAEIAAQQKIDKVKKDKQMAELKKEQDKRQAEFKKYDDWLTNHGM